MIRLPVPSSCPHSSQCSVNLKGIGKPGWRISLIIKIILDTEDQHDQVSTSTLLPAKLTNWAGGDSAIPEASPVIFATYSLGQTNLHNLFCHNKKSLKIQYWCGALWKAWEWSGMLCGGGVKKQAAEERSTQGQELSGQSCQSLHWLFSQHFDKQLKSSKLSLNSLQDCFQMALIFIFALSIIDVATKDHGHLFRFPQYENLDNPYNKIRLFSDTQRHTGAAGAAAALVYKRYRLRGDGSAHDRATDLDSSTTSQHACRVLQCNRHLWRTMLENSTSIIFILLVSLFQR